MEPSPVTQWYIFMMNKDGQANYLWYDNFIICGADERNRPMFHTHERRERFGVILTSAIHHFLDHKPAVAANRKNQTLRYIRYTNQAKTCA